MLSKKRKNKILLNEISRDAEKRIKDAVNNVLRVRIRYDDGKLPNKGRNTRYILPVAFGLTKSGKKVIRAFQTSGSTKRGAPKWKLFLLDNIITWDNGKRTFKEYKDDLIRLGLNVNGDKHMTTLFAITPFAKGDVQVSKYDNTIDPEPVFKTDVTPTVDNQKKSFINKKTIPNKEKNKIKVDNDIEKDYYQNKVDYQTTPILKKDINTKDTENNIDINNINNTNINNGDIEPVDNKPITKNDVEQTANIEDNELTKKYNDLMARMDNLNNDNNENI